VPSLLATALPPDVVLVQTSVPSDGTVSLGTEVNVLPAAIEAARARGGLVVAQLNPRVPYTYGDSVLPCDVIDYAIEAEAPLQASAPRPATGVSAAIAGRVAARPARAGERDVGRRADPLRVRRPDRLRGRRAAFGGRSSGHRAAVLAPQGGRITGVPRLDGRVTSFQHSFIVSEQGTAVIWGHDASGQAEQISSQVAHPSVREELRQAGRDLGLGV
jgi:hypothetical protein